MDNYIGRLLDNRYEIMELIGTGGMAVVYKARCNRLNRMVAIKILKEELSQDAEFRRRFHAESQAVAMLSHPNIVSVYDVSHSDNLDYIVMELIEGITLKQYMEQKGQLNWREALHFGTQIAKALEHAHSRGIIHRDIKPHNIMILKDGSVKVADFGIARITSSQNTLTREALGSVHYISPEQAKGGRVDDRSDLYSLGVVMYEMLVGRPPYDGDTPVSVAIQHIGGKATMPRELNPSIPVGLEQITMKAMCADMEQRYASATEMLAALEQFRKNPNVVFSEDAHNAAEAPVIVDPERPAPAARPAQSERSAKPAAAQKKSEAEKESGRKNGSRTALIAGIVCIVLAVCGILWFLFSYFLSDLFRKTEEDIVPQFVGKYYEDIDESAYPNFHIEVAKWQESDSVEKGYVMEQTPGEGRTVKVGSTIELTVSMGASSSQMPDLVNWSLQAAESYLKTMDLGLDVVIEYQPNDVYTDGYILSTIPEEGQTLKNGQTVTLYVSQGPELELVEVPALVGEDVEKALESIDDAGLGRGSLRYDDSDLPEGTVIFQSVEAGEMVKEGTVINLRVSKGPIVAATPEIRSISGNAEVETDETLTLKIKARADDDGVLSYGWYLSQTGSESDAVAVSGYGENNTECKVDTSKAGTYYYFCKVINTLGETKATATSDMVKVIVNTPEPTSVEKVISVEMPAEGELFKVTVRVDGEEQNSFDVEMYEVPDRTISISVTGSGTQDVDIYVDGTLWDTQTVDFGAAG